MDHRLTCPVKINITLRVMGKRADGYHEIFSAFWKKNGAEGLTIYGHSDENIRDILEVKGEPIDGENIVTRTLSLARKNGANIPPLRMFLDKVYPTGSGIGAGSGNAAALASFLRVKYGVFQDVSALAELGADVSFLASGFAVALAEGVGEKLSPEKEPNGFAWLVAFPKWRSSTAAAYAALDEYRRSRNAVVMSSDECRAEALAVLDALRRGEKVGLLPNDFLTTAALEHPEYEEAFEVVDTASAWGLCGSGSALFAVFKDRNAASEMREKLNKFDWIIQTALME